MQFSDNQEATSSGSTKKQRRECYSEMPQIQHRELLAARKCDFFWEDALVAQTVTVSYVRMTVRLPGLHLRRANPDSQLLIG